MEALLSALLPSLLAELQTPAFQAILKSILDQLIKNISAGVPALTATQLATGQVTAAAALHLTGNPIADAEAFFANFQPVAAPAAKPAGFTS